MDKVYIVGLGHGAHRRNFLGDKYFSHSLSVENCLELSLFFNEMHEILKNNEIQ